MLFQVVLEQYIEHWGKPYYDWCEKNGIAFTGHYWDHEWPNCTGVPDNMGMSAWQHMPGIDCLMNQYREDTHAQFGNVRFVKEVQSLCNQLGRERYLCEVYGAGGCRRPRPVRDPPARSRARRRRRLGAGRTAPRRGWCTAPRRDAREVARP